MSFSATVIVIGNWESDSSQGICLKFEHRYNLSTSKSYPSSVINNLEQFATLLQENQTATSVQIITEEIKSCEYFYNLLTVIGKYCPHLECLGVTLNMDEVSQEIEKSIVDIDLLDELIDEENFTSDQKLCVKTWLDFINSVKSTLQHIVMFEDARIPLFAVKMLLDKTVCPNLNIIEGGYSVECYLTSLERMQMDIASGHAVNVIFMRFLDCKDFHFENIMGFCNLRQLVLAWMTDMDYRLFESPSLTNLNSFLLFDINATAESETEARPRIDLFFPENSKLQELTVESLELSQESWDKLGERAQFLQWIYIRRSGPLVPDILLPLQSPNCQKLEILELDGPNNFKGSDISPLLYTSSGKSRYSFKLDLNKNNLSSPVDIQELVVRVLENFKNESEEDKMEGGSGFTIQFRHHTGGFEYLRPTVEGMGFIFEANAEYGRTNILNTGLKNRENPGSRYFTLLESGRRHPNVETEETRTMRES